MDYSVLHLMGLDDKVTIVSATPPSSQEIIDEGWEYFVPETQKLSETEQDDDGVTVVKESPPSSEDLDLTGCASVTVKSNNQLSKVLTTGCSDMDKWFCGGIPTNGITEFYGERGSGRTQICLQLAITAQLPVDKGGLDSCVLYICSEGRFPVNRFYEIAEHYREKYPDDLPANFGDNVFVKYAMDSKTLKDFIQDELDDLVIHLAPRKKIRLVILDTITGAFRLELTDYLKRQDAGFSISEIGSLLREYSEKHKAAIVICNDAVRNPDTGVCKAALGDALRRTVNHRIEVGQWPGRWNRTMKVQFSSCFFNPFELPFRITSEGVRRKVVQSK